MQWFVTYYSLIIVNILVHMLHTLHRFYERKLGNCYSIADKDWFVGQISTSSNIIIMRVGVFAALVKCCSFLLVGKFQVDTIFDMKLYNRIKKRTILLTAVIHFSTHNHWFVGFLHSHTTHLFQASATVRYCLTSFKVKIKLDHFCMSDGRYIDVHKFIWA